MLIVDGRRSVGQSVCPTTLAPLFAFTHSSDLKIGELAHLNVEERDNMSSSNGNMTTLKATLCIGAAALAASFIIHNRTSKCKKQQSKDDVNNTDEVNSSSSDSVVTFYNQLGISEDKLPDHIRREIHKQRKRKSKEAMISMKTPMYDNIHMLDEDREPICTISMKKAKWYIRKNIAEWTAPKAGSELSKDKDIKCIRLLFTHNGVHEGEKKSSSEKLYLRSAKQNICVSCGSDGHHIRHYIVPYSYRALLPDDYKSHMSHDIVILCPDCHVRCERSTKKRMKRMEHNLRMKMTDGNAFCSPVIEDPHLYHVRSCAIALAKWRDKIPTEKIASYEKEVRLYLADCCKDEAEKEMIILTGNDEPLTKSQLQKACSVKYRVKNPRYVPGSEVVVRSLNGDKEKIEQFIVDWRKHFIAIVDPKYMPTGWRVDNPVAKGSSFVLLV